METKGLPPRSLIVLASRRKMFFNDEYLPLKRENSKGKIRVPNSKPLNQLVDEVAQLKSKL